MHLRKIFDRLAIDVRKGDPREDRVHWPPVEACAVQYDGSVVVRDFRPATLRDALHEAMHAIVGADSLLCEANSGLMALEWAVAQHMGRASYEKWRSCFGDYGFDNDEAINVEIGDSDEFLAWATWHDCVHEAVRRGCLTPEGNVVWGIGPRLDFVRISAVLYDE
jgi:hypothetical protein